MSIEDFASKLRQLRPASGYPAHVVEINKNISFMPFAGLIYEEIM
jgi:hypothetical protein